MTIGGATVTPPHKGTSESAPRLLDSSKMIVALKRHGIRDALADDAVSVDLRPVRTVMS